MSTFPQTHGWDTVFAIDIREVNKALAKLPESPQYAIEEAIRGATATLTWSFSGWQILDTPGGSRLQVQMAFSDDAALSRSDKPEPRSLGGLACNVTFEANFVKTDPVTRQLRAVTEGEWAIVDLVALEGAELPSEFDDRTTIKSAIKRWFGESEEAVALFQQEFATVDISVEMEQAGLDWLRPKELGYAGGVMADGVTKALGILAMTGDKVPPENALLLSPYAIPPNAKAAYILSAELFLRHMLLPACAGAFSAVDADFEVYGNASDKLRNLKTLSFKQKVDVAERDASIDAGQLRFSFEGDKLAMSITPMHVATAHEFLTLDAVIDEEFTASLIPNPTVPGATIFALSTARYKEPKIDVVMSTGAEIAEAAASFVVAALAAALTVYSFKGPLQKLDFKLGGIAVKIWARIAAAALLLVGEALANIPGWIDLAVKGETRHIPDFSPVLNSGLAGISWPGVDATLEPVAGAFANGLMVTIESHF
jgi:hypothetical protein